MKIDVKSIIIAFCLHLVLLLSCNDTNIGQGSITNSENQSDNLLGNWEVVYTKVVFYRDDQTILRELFITPSMIDQRSVLKYTTDSVMHFMVSDNCVYTLLGTYSTEGNIIEIEYADPIFTLPYEDTAGAVGEPATFEIKDDSLSVNIITNYRDDAPVYINDSIAKMDWLQMSYRTDEEIPNDQWPADECQFFTEKRRANNGLHYRFPLITDLKNRQE